MATKKKWRLINHWNGWINGEGDPLSLVPGTVIEGETGEYIANQHPDWVEEIGKPPVSEGPPASAEFDEDDAVKK